VTWHTLSRLFVEDWPSDHPISLRDGGAIPFARLLDDVGRAAMALAGCPRAALLCRDTYAFAVGFFALLHAGAEVMLPLNRRQVTTLDLTGASNLLVDDAFLAGLPDEPAPLTAVAADAARITFFTSGSSGTPKRVVRTLGMLEREVATIEAVHRPLVGRGPVLATVSHQHLYGLTFKLLWPLASGCPFDAATYELWETLVAALRPGAVVISSPAHLSRLGGLPALPRSGKPTAVFSAGAPLSPEAAADTRHVLGCLPIEIFGSTETGAIATRRQEQGNESWTLLPGNVQCTDASGRLLVSSPYVTGWTRTEDLVEPEPGGFRFLGRADRVVKIEGKRVEFAEVESALAALHWVEVAAAVLLDGKPPKLAAAVVLTAEGRGKLAAMGHFRFSSRLLLRTMGTTQEPAAIPRRWRFISALPAQPMGKCHDASIAALFAQPPI
jgi:acyl-coenzyme A synthetase/AMP-(fatty) acid ligase